MQLVLILLLAVALIAGTVWHFRRGRTMLADWAAREGVELLSAERCMFWTGPFWWRTGKDNIVYRVRVRGRDGRERSGYARCGGLFLGMLSDQVTVVWDE
jgi:hypothetical protein